MNTYVLQPIVNNLSFPSLNQAKRIDGLIGSARRIVLGVIFVISIVAGFVFVGDNLGSIGYALGTLVSPDIIDLSEASRGAATGIGHY